MSFLGVAVTSGAMVASAGQDTGGMAIEPATSDKKPDQANPAKGAKGMFVYIGTYSKGGSKGIYVYRMDATTGELTFTGQTAETQNPSFVVVHPTGRYLYAVSEVGKTNGKPGGAVSAFVIDPETGGLTLLNQQASQGTSPCHLSVDATGQLLTVANYSSGTVAALPVQEDGKLGEATSVKQHEGSSVNPQRQKEPHAHSCTIDAANRFAFAADLGVDKVFIYRVDPEKGELTPNDVPFVQVHPGAGPRHFDFHPSNRYGYVINEIDSTITAFDYNAEKGTLSEIQSISTLPADFSGKNSCADIHVHPSGKFLYGSNRGHDSIAIFSIDEATGRLTLVGHESTQGRTPRNFGLDPTGKFLVAANQDTNNIVAFRIDQETGRLTPTGQTIEVPAPVCVKFRSVRE
ncbi:MAG: lactonase family protein [Armatimonadota bacterium]|nr:lactonase family protein [Armatimonadota bacterium]